MCASQLVWTKSLSRYEPHFIESNMKVGGLRHQFKCVQFTGLIVKNWKNPLLEANAALTTSWVNLKILMNILKQLFLEPEWALSQ